MKKAQPRSPGRRHIRHPSRIPIRFALPGKGRQHSDYLRNVGQGGVCFASPVAIGVGETIRLQVPVFGQDIELEGRVSWCRAVARGYEVGVGFPTQQDRFCVRMVEQLCYIEDYRAAVLKEEGRQLSGEEAAREWIDRFAGQFPGLQ